MTYHSWRACGTSLADSIFTQPGDIPGELFRHHVTPSSFVGGEEFIDYSVCPPEIGQTIIVNESGSEVSTIETSSKPASFKRAFCSFSSNTNTDPDEYPFNAIMYGEAGPLCGLSYNDHSYALPEEAHTTSIQGEESNRLALLAKLACTKRDSFVSSTIIPDSTHFHQRVSRIEEDTVSSEKPIQSSPTLATNILSYVRCSSMVKQNRAFLLSSSRPGSNSPFQMQRVGGHSTTRLLLRPKVLSPSGDSHRTSGGSELLAHAGVYCICGFQQGGESSIQCENCKEWQNGKYVGALPLISPTGDVCNTQNMNTLSHQRGIKMSATTFASKMQSDGQMEQRQSHPRTPAISTAGRQIISPHISAGNLVRCVPGRQVHIKLATSSMNVNAADNTGSVLVDALDRSRRPGDYVHVTQSHVAAHYPQRIVRHEPSSCVSVAVSSKLNQPARLSKRKQDFYNCAPIKLSRSTLDSTMGDHAGSSPFATPVDYQALPIQQRSVSPSSSLELTVNNGGVGSNSDVMKVCLDTVGSPDASYEDVAADIRMTDRLQERLSVLLSQQLSTNNKYLNDPILTAITRYSRYRIVSVDFNQRGLIAIDSMHVGDPVIEYRGVFMLLDEYNAQYDFRRHYNPFALFYKKWDKLAICVDARQYGNEARFIRRSCTPNCEVRHIPSTTLCQSPSGRTDSAQPATQSTACLRLVVLATQPIPVGTELTLPFDFDYTFCQYTIRCACARKTCAVARSLRNSGTFGSPRVGNMLSVMEATESDAPTVGAFSSPFGCTPTTRINSTFGKPYVKLSREQQLSAESAAAITLTEVSTGVRRVISDQTTEVGELSPTSFSKPRVLSKTSRGRVGRLCTRASISAGRPRKGSASSKKSDARITSSENSSRLLSKRGDITQSVGRGRRGRIHVGVAGRGTRGSKRGLLMGVRGRHRSNGRPASVTSNVPPVAAVYYCRKRGSVPLSRFQIDRDRQHPLSTCFLSQSSESDNDQALSIEVADEPSHIRRRSSSLASTIASESSFQSVGRHCADPSDINSPPPASSSMQTIDDTTQKYSNLQHQHQLEHKQQRGQDACRREQQPLRIATSGTSSELDADTEPEMLDDDEKHSDIDTTTDYIGENSIGRQPRQHLHQGNVSITDRGIGDFPYVASSLSTEVFGAHHTTTPKRRYNITRAEGVVCEGNTKKDKCISRKSTHRTYRSHRGDRFHSRRKLELRRERTPMGYSAKREKQVKRKRLRRPGESIEKSREETWMAEVLRRIERMEKKQQKQRFPASHVKRESEELKMSSPTDRDLSVEHESGDRTDAPSLFQCSPRSISKSDNAAVDRAAFAERHIERLQTEQVYADQTDPVKREMPSFSIEKGYSKPVTHMAETDSKTNASVEEQKDCLSVNAFVKGSECDYLRGTLIENTDVFGESRCAGKGKKKSMDTEVIKSSLLHTGSRKRRNTGSYKDATPAVVNKRSTSFVDNQKLRRRRSPISGVCNVDDVGGNVESREERWLKMQLRRIDQMEKQQSNRTGNCAVGQLTRVTSNSSSPRETSPQAVIADDAYPRLMNTQYLYSPADNNGDLSNVLPNTITSKLGNGDAAVNNGDGSQVLDISTSTTDIGPPSEVKRLDTMSQAEEEADCGFIVYRAREKDPMAKFSRARSVAIIDPVQTPAFATAERSMSLDTDAQWNYPEENQQHQNIEQVNHSHVQQYCSQEPVCIELKSDQTTRLSSAPRPTKKRWLSQALSEGGVNSPIIHHAAVVPAVDVDIHSTPQTRFAEFSIAQDCLVPHVPHLPATQLNPKKRIISQMSSNFVDSGIKTNEHIPVSSITHNELISDLSVNPCISDSDGAVSKIHPLATDTSASNDQPFVQYDDLGIFERIQSVTDTSMSGKVEDHVVGDVDETSASICQTSMADVKVMTETIDKDNVSQRESIAQSESDVPHTPKLPPKKATLKRQEQELRLQEMRKVRVSLSEYRRRRGIAPGSTGYTTDQYVSAGITDSNLKQPHSVFSQPNEIDRIQLTMDEPVVTCTVVPMSQLGTIAIESVAIDKNKEPVDESCDAVTTFDNQVTGSLENNVHEQISWISLCGGKQSDSEKPENASAIMEMFPGTTAVDTELGPHTPSEPADDELAVASTTCNTEDVNRTEKHCESSVLGNPVLPISDDGKHEDKWLIKDLAEHRQTTETVTNEVDINGVACTLTTLTTDARVSGAVELDSLGNTHHVDYSGVASDGVNHSSSPLSSPPPPPPPLSSSTLLIGTSDESAKHRQLSSRSHSTRDYFIRRDKAIRAWQERSTLQHQMVGSNQRKSGWQSSLQPPSNGVSKRNQRAHCASPHRRHQPRDSDDNRHSSQPHQQTQVLRRLNEGLSGTPCYSSTVVSRSRQPLFAQSRHDLVNAPENIREFDSVDPVAINLDRDEGHSHEFHARDDVRWERRSPRDERDHFHHNSHYGRNAGRDCSRDSRNRNRDRIDRPSHRMLHQSTSRVENRHRLDIPSNNLVPTVSTNVTPTTGEGSSAGAIRRQQWPDSVNLFYSPHSNSNSMHRSYNQTDVDNQHKVGSNMHRTSRGPVYCAESGSGFRSPTTHSTGAR